MLKICDSIGEISTYLGSADADANVNANDNNNENEEIIQRFSGIIDVLERYPFTMSVVALKELVLYHHLDCDTHIDLVQMIGVESDFLR